MIKAENIKKGYGKLHVLNGINLQIERSEVVTILGKSGAGKSTLLHILGTLDNPDEGSLYINETLVSKLSQKELAEFRNKNIGFVFQFHHLLNEFTAVENVCIPAFIKGTKKNEAEHRAKELLEYLGLGDRLTHKPTELSGGEQQRVAFARALINNPLVIFADEPTGNLDGQSSADLHQLILDLRKDFDQTFVIVTHNEDLADLSDRRLYMESGVFV